MWDPQNGAKVTLASGTTSHQFVGDNTTTTSSLTAWHVTYTGVPAKAQAALTTDPSGCRQLTAAASGDTPLLNVEWTGKSNGNSFPLTEEDFTVTYTSGGTSHTLTYKWLYTK
ncbi:hypothetical protein [Acidipropionibacterium timonense]|uniref:hypothetical protein n=1 Tax=Acidipropionibacterium timonense TaxID=2161818 RepID=UPI0010310995|nr:hypothetical protein [Acidipropionibacterium timonense]